MIKAYFKSFADESLYNAFKISELFVKPNVSYIESLEKLIFTQKEKPLKINGIAYTDKNIVLAPGGTYEISGTHYGTITVNANEFTPNAWTTIILNNVTIISDESYGILYDCPEQNNKGYQGLNINLYKDSQNFIICNKENIDDNDSKFASIDSWKDMNVQGVGYLSVYNNVGHGLRAETMNIAGAHIYMDVEHDGVHGKTVNVLDGVFYFQKAKDGFGTTDNGQINVFGGEFEFAGVTQDAFDSKQPGIFAIENITGNNFVNIENMYDEGTVTAYPTKEDYEAKTNGVQINLAIETTVNSGWFYNADENENVVKSAEPAGHVVWVWDDPVEVLFDAPQAYLINAEYNVVEVTGKITRPIVRATDAITIGDNPTFSKSKGKLNGGYDNKLDIYLNGAVIVTEGHAPSIANLPDAGRVKIIAVKDTINAIINKDTIENDSEGLYDHDAIKSENNMIVEAKNESILYVTSLIGDGLDAGDLKITDSKGSIIIKNCGERGIKGTYVVIGPNAEIPSGIINPYIEPTDTENYTTFNGILIVKDNCIEHEISEGVVTNEDPESKLTGFADIYGRNGKHSKGKVFFTNNELKGVVIVNSIGARDSIDLGNASNLYVNRLLITATNPIDITKETYKAVPYEEDPIV